MELIATHLGADFDAFASMIAARRLYPEAELFFPGSREESLRRMLESGLIEFTELRSRQIDPAAVGRVILCDIRQRDRIGVIADWIAARPGEIELVAYDHHPPTDHDLEVDGGVIDPGVGATSTLMVEQLRRRGLEPPPNEATVLMMGIYEDTGSLTNATTSERDFAAAGWLLGRGADLAAVRRFALASLDPARLDLLHRMTRELEVFRVRGHRVGMVAVELGGYVDELAPLVSRCADLFALPLLFAIFGEGDAVTLIARGDEPGVDLGRLLADFAGGGGHPTAAAARLKPGTALEVRERLLGFLGERLPAAARAADLAIGGFFVVPAATTIAAAKEMLNQRRVNAAPVAAPAPPGGERPEPGRLAGAVTRQTLDAALQHGLGERPVERVMDPELEWVDPDTPAEEIGGRILERHPRFVLVGEGGEGAERRAVGLITRMQVLRHLHGRLEAFDDRIARRSEGRAEERKGIGELFAELSPALAHRIEVAARVARHHRLPVYLVGGLVRDLLLGRDNRDLDLVVEGDGPHFAHLLAAELGGRVREHREFLTAVVVDAEGFHVDVATARSEFYRAPAALPEVETSAIRQDLYRRDFTINTLAIQLGPGDAPVLIDFFGGRRDLDNRVIRVLHSLSFIDDPTRVLRAVRLEQRLGFAISPETLQLVEVALTERIFDRLTGSRLREELILLLDDPAVALRGVERLASLELLAVLHPDLELTDAVRTRLRAALTSFDWYRFEGLTSPPVALWRLVLAALASDLDEAAVARLADRLQLGGEDLRVLVGGAARRARAAAELEPAELAPHRIAAALAGLPGEDLLLLAGEGPGLRERVRRDLTELRRFRLGVRGADLVAAGVEPGPAIGVALQRTREARLDGAVGRDDEPAFALAAAREAEEMAKEKSKSWVGKPDGREAGETGSGVGGPAAGREEGR